jgi:hypothetical protein
MKGSVGESMWFISFLIISRCFSYLQLFIVISFFHYFSLIQGRELIVSSLFKSSFGCGIMYHIHKYNEQTHTMLANKNATNDKKISLS